MSAGKPRNGRMLLKAFQQENQIMIMVEDDGKGLNAEHIKKKAVEKKD
jgi:two-component system chemotaxis sensor kinase CheA